MRPTHEFSLELTAQELMDPLDLSSLKEMAGADVIALTSMITPAPSASVAAHADNEFEIELSADEIDQLLEGKL
jgi:hypothetical protein